MQFTVFGMIGNQEIKSLKYSALIMEDDSVDNTEHLEYPMEDGIVFINKPHIRPLDMLSHANLTTCFYPSNMSIFLIF